MARWTGVLFASLAMLSGTCLSLTPTRATAQGARSLQSAETTFRVDLQTDRFRPDGPPAFTQPLPPNFRFPNKYKSPEIDQEPAYSKHPQYIRFLQEMDRHLQTVHFGDLTRLYADVLTPSDNVAINKCNTHSYQELWRTLRTNSKPNWSDPILITHVANHDLNCLNGLQSGIGQFGHWSDSSFERAMSAIGVLYFRTKRMIHCTVTSTSEREVVTARHCLAKAKISEDIWSGAGAEDLAIVMLSEPTRLYNVIAIKELGGATVAEGSLIDLNDQHKDVVLLEADSPLRGGSIAISTSPTAPKTPVLVPGFNMHLAYADGGELNRRWSAPESASKDESSLIEGWTSFMRADVLPTCRVFHISETTGCVAHTCQTLEGWSGGPILVANGDELELLAVHSGLFNAKSTCIHGISSQDRRYIPNAVPNTGVVLTGRQIHFVSR